MAAAQIALRDSKGLSRRDDREHDLRRRDDVRERGQQLEAVREPLGTLAAPAVVATTRAPPSASTRPIAEPIAPGLTIPTVATNASLLRDGPPAPSLVTKCYKIVGARHRGYATTKGARSSVDRAADF